jgi:hypothetical protein
LPAHVAGKHIATVEAKRLTLIKDGFALLCFDDFLKFYSAAIRG